MKITSIEIQADGSSDICTLSFRDPRRENSYNVKGVVGLDAEEILPRFYGSTASSKLYDLMLQKREIVVRAELNPNYSLNETPSDLRDRLYRYISASRTGLVTVRFKNLTTVIASVAGFITKFESALFTKTPEVQITIRCKEPMLKAPNRVSVDVSGLNPPMLTTIQDTLSTAPHGFRFTMNVLNPNTGFAIYDPDSDWTFGVGTNGAFTGFLAGDVVHFSSEYNNKYIYLTRAPSTTIHIADAIEIGSQWPILFPGDNVFSFVDPADYEWATIDYYPTYWGI